MGGYGANIKNFQYAEEMFRSACGPCLLRDTQISDIKVIKVIKAIKVIKVTKARIIIDDQTSCIALRTEFHY